ncbi:MAG TPA: hypothetical protein VGK47_00815 [Nitrososphaeraceae archaeon]
MNSEYSGVFTRFNDKTYRQGICKEVVKISDRMKKEMGDEEYVIWIFVLGEY